MPRVEFSKRVSKAIVARATNSDGQITCEGCGLVLGFKAYDIDHKIAEALCDHTMKRNLKPEDGQLLCKPCHKIKTKDDVHKTRKADRQKNRHTGVKRPAGKIANRGFETAQKRPAIDKAGLPPLKPRPMFAPVQKGLS